jgi:isoleucyl-tRNA synthetase
VASIDWRKEVRFSYPILQFVIKDYRKVRNTIRFMLANLFDFHLQQHFTTTTT